MQHHIDQAEHNQSFHDCVEGNFTDQFCDWKITIIFYTAIHWLKALAAKRGIDIGETHFDIDKNVNPDRPNTKMSISRNAWREYKNLFNYSQTARYNGIADMTTFGQMMFRDHNYCKTHLSNFLKYIKGQIEAMDKVFTSL